MDLQTLENELTKIDEKFLLYRNASAHSGNDVLLEKTEQEIIISFWKTVSEVYSLADAMKDHADTFVKTVQNCIKAYFKKETYVGFGKYTYSSIKRALNTNLSADSFESKTQITLSEREHKNRKRIEKAYRIFSRMYGEDKKAFLKYALENLSSEDGFDEESLRLYLFSQQTGTLYVTSPGSEEEYCVADAMGTSQDDGIVLSVESDEDLAEKLAVINEQWLLQKNDAKPLLSELLTLEILKDFQKNNATQQHVRILTGFEFICIKMVENFYKNIEYRLPDQQDIAKKYNLTKAGVSVKMKRFKEGLVRPEK